MVDNGKDRYAPIDREIGALESIHRLSPEAAMKKISDKEFEGLVRGVISIAAIIFNQVKPDLIIAPDRGARPLIWMLEVIARREGIQMPMVDPIPLGTHTDIYHYRKLRGMSGLGKIERITKHLETIFELQQRPGEKKIKKILLLDEARTGGTISTTAHHYDEALEKLKSEKGWENEFFIVMAHDTAHNPAKVLSGGATAMLAGKKGWASQINLPLGYMDRPALLPIVLSQDPAVRKSEATYKKWELLESVENEPAKEVFQKRTKEVLEKIGWHGLDEEPSKSR